MSMKIRNKEKIHPLIDSDNFFILGMLLGIFSSMVNYNLYIILIFIFPIYGTVFLDFLLLLIISIAILMINNKFSIDFSLDDFFQLTSTLYVSIAIGSILGYLSLAFIFNPFFISPLYSFALNTPGPQFDLSFFSIFYEITSNLYFSFNVLIIFLFFTMFKLSNSVKVKKVIVEVFNETILSLFLVISLTWVFLDLFNQFVLNLIFNNQAVNGYIYFSILNILFIVKIVLLIVLAFYLIEKLNIRIPNEKIVTIFVITYLISASILLIGLILFAPFLNQLPVFSQVFLENFISAFYLNAICFAIIFNFKYNPEMTFFE